MSWLDRIRYDDDRRDELARARQEDDRIREQERRRDREIYEEQRRRDRDAAIGRDVERDYW
jgi:hypothetical protein